MSSGQDPAPGVPGDAGPRAPDAVGRPRVSTLRVLRVRNFRIYFFSALLSNIGTWLHNIAAGLLVYHLTRSTLLVGVIGFAQYVGTMLLTPWSGVAADRFDRRRLLAVTQVLAAAIGAGLAACVLLEVVTAPIVILATFLLGFAQAFAVPALMALVPLLVDRRDLDAAVALNSVSFNLARAVGPVVGAFMVEWAGFGVAFALNAGTFTVFALALTMLRPSVQSRTAGIRPRLMETVRLVREHGVWGALLVATVVVSSGNDPVFTLPPELVRDVFMERDLYVGLLMGAFGVGATLTAFTLVPRLAGRPGVLPGAMVVQGVGMVGVGLAPGIEVALVAMAVSGGGFLAAITRITTRLQIEVPDLQRGRVMALWTLAFLGTRPVVSLLDGAVAELAGARVAAVVMGVPVAVLALWVRRHVPPAGASRDGPAAGVS